MADARSNPDASTFSRPWFEQIGISGFAAVGAMLGFAISLPFVLNASPADPAPLLQRIAEPSRPVAQPPSLKPALQVAQSPAQAVTQTLELSSTPVQQAAADQHSPDQHAAEHQPAPDQDDAHDRTQVASTPEQSPPASQQDTRRGVAAIAPSSGRSEDAVRSSDTPHGTTATGIPLHVGPRGGVYHYSKSGNKVYERKRR